MSPQQIPDRPTKNKRRDGHTDSEAHTNKPTRITDYFTSRHNKTGIDNGEDNQQKQERRRKEDEKDQEDEDRWWGDTMDQ